MTKKLDTLKQKQTQINAQIQQLEAQQKLKARRQETRRQILVGEYFLNKFRNEGRWHELQQELQTIIHRDTDRKLFESP